MDGIFKYRKTAKYIENTQKYWKSTGKYQLDQNCQHVPKNAQFVPKSTWESQWCTLFRRFFGTGNSISRGALLLYLATFWRAWAHLSQIHFGPLWDILIRLRSLQHISVRLGPARYYFVPIDISGCISVPLTITTTIILYFCSKQSQFEQMGEVYNKSITFTDAF